MYLITKVVSGKYADGRINDVFSGVSDLRRAIAVIERDIEKNNKNNVLDYSYVFFAEDSDNYDGWFAIESGSTIGNAVIKGKGKVYETIVASLKNILIKDDNLDHIWNDPDDEDIYICDAGYEIRWDGQNLFGIVSMIGYALSKVVSDTHDISVTDDEETRTDNYDYVNDFVIWFETMVSEDNEAWTEEALKEFISASADDCAIWDMIDEWTKQSEFYGDEYDKATGDVEDYKVYVKNKCDKICKDRLVSMGVLVYTGRDYVEVSNND